MGRAMRTVTGNTSMEGRDPESKVWKHYSLNLPVSHHLETGRAQ